MDNSFLYKVAKTPRAILMLEGLDLSKATNIENAKWEKFQIDELNSDSVFGIERKCRQVGYSFVLGCRAVADAFLDKRDSVINSINKDESYEKIRFARNIYENLRTPFPKPKIVTDNRTELEFSNGARIISTANARGKPQSNFFIDEWAWKKNAKEVWTAAQPVISKGGVFRGGSSTNGASGIFWEIDTQSLQPYPDFRRSFTRWWETEAFCLDIREAIKTAETLTTAERVERFARPRLKLIFNNSILEDFQQEYEADYVDEASAWITWEEIRKAENDDLICFKANCRENISEALNVIDNLISAVGKGQVESVFYGGMDIGRTRNTTEIFLIGKTTTDAFPLRLMITLDNCDFDNQFAVLEKVLLRLPVTSLLIDRNGIGRNISEKAEKAFHSKAQGADFTNATKALWAGNVKMLFQQNKVSIPVHRDLAYQIHSIKKNITPSKNVVFDTERNEKHHADKFWALALALTGAIEVKQTSGSMEEEEWL